MGIGYVIGCMLSILFWKIDRHEIFLEVYNKIRNKIKNSIIITIIFIMLVIFLWWIGKVKIEISGLKEIINLAVCFLVLDVSNTERKNLKRKDKVYFYNSISSISKSLVCGFIAPLFYMFLFGNNFAIIYTFVFQLSSIEDLYIFRPLWKIMNIVPSVIADIFLYLVFIIKRRKIKIQADYMWNLINRPLLNVDIIAAYIEDLNFYYYYTENYNNYMIKYGSSNKEVDEACIRSYLGIEYLICMMAFLLFFMLLLWR